MNAKHNINACKDNQHQAAKGNGHIRSKMAVRVYLKFLHFSLHGNTVHDIDAAGNRAETVLGHAQPIREGAQDTMGVLDARHLLLELLDGLLQEKRTEDDAYYGRIRRTVGNKCCCIH